MRTSAAPNAYQSAITATSVATGRLEVMCLVMGGKLRPPRRRSDGARAQISAGSPWCRHKALADERRRLDLAPQDLARRALRERVLEPHVARVLVGRDAGFDELLDVLRGGPAAGLEHDRGADLLAELVVGDA